MKTIIYFLMLFIVTFSLNAQWYSQTSGVPCGLNSTSFINSSTGWIATDTGKILKTTNGGLSWNAIMNLPLNHSYSVFFINENTGWAAGNYTRASYPNTQYDSLLIKTTNGGLNWFIQSNQGRVTIWSIQFIDALTGWLLQKEVGAVNLPGKILKTTNGGDSWFFQIEGIINNLFFINNLTGYAGGNIEGQMNNGTILRSTNGGTNWDTVSSGLPYWLFDDIYFVDFNTGWTMGYNGNENISKTTNGGVNWIVQYTTTPDQSLGPFHFINSLTGWAAGNIIIKTTNGGMNWIYQWEWNSFIFLNDIKFINSSTGFAVGDSGLILKTTNGGQVFVRNISTEIPNRFSLYQNYPNPFNPTTNIKFDIPKKSFVKLVIYNLLGKEVKTLVNEEMNTGSYQADWNASTYPNGVYFYRIQTEGYTEVKRMILTK